MSESPTAPLAPGRSDVLPGYTLTPLSLTSLAELEDEFGRRHVAKLVGGATLANPGDWDRAMRLASEEVRRLRFAVGTEEWDNAMQSYSSVPLLLYHSLRRNHPNVTREQAAAMLTDDNFTDVRRAILELTGYVFFKKNTQGQAAASTAPSTGEGTSPHSDATAESTANDPPSITTKSAA